MAVVRDEEGKVVGGGGGDHLVARVSQGVARVV